MRFKSNEASSIYYTTDGSTPTTASTEWKPIRARAVPLPLQLAPGTNLKWIATDFKGNTSAVKAQVLGRTDTPGTVGGSVPATLSLTLGTTPSFGAFTAGVAKDYLASTTATVVCSAGDAALIVQDTSSLYTNRLVNGSYALTQELQVKNNAGVFQTMPAGIKFWGAPTGSESVPIEFKQPIGANDPLRPGSYNKR